MKKFNSILLIDDDSVNNFITERLLKKLAIAGEVNVCTGGQMALDFLQKANKFQKSYPDLILLDINMPGMDGFEFLEKFQKFDHLQKPIIVALTTSNIENDILKMNQMGIEHYLNKPLQEANIFALYKSLSAKPD